MSRVMMIQPGAVGDIFVCLPIAKWYADQGYEIVWPMRKQFHKHLRNIDYVTPIFLDEDVLDEDWLRSDVMKCFKLHKEGAFKYALNLADRGPGPAKQLQSENFEQAKYRLASVPIEEKHKLDWVRFRDNEDYIYDEFVGDNNAPYAFVHATTSDGESDIDTSFIHHRIVTCEDIGPKFNIFDWYRVIVDAAEIFVTESSVHQFCDGIVNKITPFRYLLPRASVIDQVDMEDTWRALPLTKSNHWRRDYLDG